MHALGGWSLLPQCGDVEEARLEQPRCLSGSITESMVV